MSPGEIVWLFFLFSALQPVLKQRLLEASRQRLIAKIDISDVSTTFAMEQIKYTTALPLTYIVLEKEKAKVSA